MKRYTVRAVWWEHGWELHVGDAGVTQSTTLAKADVVVRDYLATLYDTDPATFGVDIRPDLGGLEYDAAEARRRMRAAQSEVADAAAGVRQVATQLRASGCSVRDSAVIMGVSPGRVSQLLG